MVLLDLLGAPNPTFYSYISSGDKWFNHMVDTEYRLNAIGGMTHNAHSGAVSQGPKNYFQPYSFRGGIEDDHVPFMIRNVRNNTVSHRTHSIAVHFSFSGAHFTFDSIPVSRLLA